MSQILEEFNTTLLSQQGYEPIICKGTKEGHTCGEILAYHNHKTIQLSRVTISAKPTYLRCLNCGKPKSWRPRA